MDTGGMEKFDSIISSYYKEADCCILVYDITKVTTFEKIKNYYTNWHHFVTSSTAIEI